MATVDELIVRIRADTSQLEREMKKVGGTVRQETTGMAARFRALAPAIGAVGGAMAALAAIRLFQNGFRDLLLAERSFLRIEGVLKATGHAAGLTADQLQNLADQIEQNSFFTAEQVMDASAALATFKSVSGDVFEQAVRLSTDLAEVFQQDLRMGAVQLGKALEDPIEGITALRRVGVSFTEAEREMIEAMVEAGQKAEAQRLILKTLEEQVGGAAGNAAGGLAGAVDNLGDALGQMSENMAESAAEALNLEGFIRGVTDAVNELNERGGFLATIKQYLPDLYELHQMSNYYAKAKQGGFVTEVTQGDFMSAEPHGPNPRPRPIRASGTSSGTNKTLEKQNDLLNEANRIIEQNRTPMETYIENVKKANQLKEAGLLTNIEYNREIQRQSEILDNELSDSLDKVEDKTIQTVRVMKEHFADALDELAFDFENFGDGVSNILEGIARDMFRQNISGPLSEQASGLFSGIASSIGGSLFGGGGTTLPWLAGARASGGPVRGGSTYLVGEEGPELFTPNMSGMVHPNGSGESSTNVYITNSFQSGITRQEMASMIPLIEARTKAAVFASIERGGREAAIVGRKS